MWWLFPDAAEVATDGGRPDIHLTAYNYVGTREMGDLGDRRTGAVLQFGVEFPRTGDRVAEARRSLGSKAEVRPLVPETVEAEVVFAGINSARQANSRPTGESEEAGVWTERRFAIGLTPEETAAVTDSWRDGSIIISVNLVVSARVVRTRSTGDLEAIPELAPILADG